MSKSKMVRHAACLALALPLALGSLAGCAYDTQTAVAADKTPTRTVLYPGGRYQLYGDGVGTPYYWVWVPTGGNIANAPPPLPTMPTVPVTTPVVTTTTAPATTVPAGTGHYQLYGNGTTQPYYWVWVPTGATPPPPPRPPRS